MDRSAVMWSSTTIWSIKQGKYHTLLYANITNGTLASGAAAQPSSNAILADNIIVNEAVLGDSYQLMAANAEQWVPFADFTGIFDGAGYTISGIYSVSKTANAVGLFLTNNGTIRNLTVDDSYIQLHCGDADSVHAAGIAANNSGLIENVTYRGYVGVTGSGINTHASGIVGSNGTDGIIRYASQEGKVVSPSSAAAIVSYSRGIAEYCTARGYVSGNYSGGIVCAQSGGSIANCFTAPTAVIEGRTSAAGIAQAITGSSISSCYSTAKVSSLTVNANGIYSEANSTNVSAPSPSYFLTESASGGIISGIAERKSAGQFESGEVAYLLGSSFGQSIGTDKYPVFNNGTNGVFFVDGTYANISVPTAEKLIAAIGRVGLTGSANCFTNLVTARNAYNALSPAQQGEVKNSSLLTSAEKDREAALAELNALIAALNGDIDADSGPAIDAAKTAYSNYQSRSGDLSQVIDANLISEAEGRYFVFREAEIGSGITKKTIDGKEYYVLTSADELFWFARYTNGKLADSTGAVPDANALLANDIAVNADMLRGILISGITINPYKAAMLRQWTPINSFTGIFDGQGHSIHGLYINAQSGTQAMFGTITDATIKNLTIGDTYFSGSYAAGFAIDSKGSTLIEKCAFSGVLNGYTRSAGIVAHDFGSTVIRNSYVEGTIRIQLYQDGSSFLGGITATANDKNPVIENCYVVADFGSVGASGAIIGLAVSPITMKNCYFETNESVKSAIGDNKASMDPSGATAYTLDKFSTGAAAYKLGSAFGQDLAKDVYPVFNNGSNTVYYVNGSYVNRSLQVVKDMIDSIGTVALDGNENCFGKTADAQKAFGALSAAMQNAIGANYRNKLQQAVDSYDGVLEALKNEIPAIRPLNKTDRDSKYNALIAKIEAYTDRGGDVNKISGYAELATIKAELDHALLKWLQEDTEEAIQTRVADEKTYYILTNKVELDWFIALVNGTLLTDTPQNVQANAILESDVLLNSNLVNTFYSNNTVDVGKAASFNASAGMTGSYGGIFDGAGHSISGLYLPEGSLFDTLTDGAEIKNLTLRDTVVQAGNGGFVKKMSSGSKVTACTFSGVLLSATINTGGIAGETAAGAAITNCRVSGIISSTQKYVGGIVGKNAGSITTSGAIDIALTSSGVTPSLGGITGQNTASGSIENCCVRGTVIGAAKSIALAQPVGGIAGDNAGTLKNCYNTAAVSGATTVNVGGIAGKGSGTYANCYYLEGCVISKFHGIGTAADTSGKTQSQTAAQFADGTVTTALGDAFVQRGDYPELKALLVSYPLAVVSGTDVTNAGPYTAGTKISIKADSPASGKVFSGWAADVAGVVFADASAAETTVTMPNCALTVTANYKAVGGTPSEDTYDGHVTISFADHATRISGEKDVKYPDPLGTIVSAAEVGYYKGENMAEVTLRLLKEKGISYSNSGTTTANFYLQFIGGFTVDGLSVPKLGEFDCGAGSGWMVTLNNWFINQGASSFEVEDGDIIKWQYTCQYGKDIGHNWDNPSAKITGLTFKQNYGTLSPAFKDGVNGYIYTIPSSVKSICLEAEQENYWAKLTYTAGGATYKPMQEIPVKNGTVIELYSAYYKNYTDASPVDTHRVTITIQVDGEAGVGGTDLLVDNVVALIKAIGTVTKDSGVKITAARDAYNKLSAEQKKMVVNYETLTQAEKEYAKLTGKIPFTDIKTGAWYYDAVKYTYENGLFSGASDIAFSPDAAMTRGMLATVLYRLEGSPAVTGKNNFTDVKDGQYYTNAVIWASVNGIVGGYGNGLFGVNDSVTREQMAKMVFAYTQYKKYDATKRSDFAAYTDVKSISAWALDAMKWANAEGLINGRTETTLAPTGTATRAEVASILMRFCKNVAK